MEARSRRKPSRLSFLVAVVLAMFTTSFDGLASSDYIEPDRLMPESIEELIAAIQKDPSSEKIRPKTLSTGIGESATVGQADLIRPEILEAQRTFFLGEASFLGVQEDIDRFAYKMFEQWLYLEIFRIKRSEFLMINYAKLLVLSRETPDNLAAKFESYFPAEHLAFSPYLSNRHQQTVAQLQSATDESRNAARDYLKGFLESVYLTQAALNRKRELLEARYDSEDDRYSEGMEQIGEKESILEHSSGFLAASAFQRLVAPFVDEEALPTQMRMEAAVNRYLHRLDQFLAEKRTIEDLYEYVNDTGMIQLNREFVDILASDNAGTFRSRIQRAFPLALGELQENMEFVIQRHKFETMSYPVRSLVTRLNTTTKEDMREHASWLDSVFQEQIIHWLLTDEYPYLQSAAEGLSNFVSEELRRRKIDRLVEISAATLLFSVSPLGRMGNRVSSWMGPNLLRFWRYTNLVLKGGLVSYFAYETYKQYLHWQRVGQLAKTNLEGTGLTSLVQLESARKGLILRGLLAGGTTVLSLSTSRGFWSQIKQEQKSTNRIMKAFERTWQRNPIALAALNRNSLSHWRGMQASLRNLQWKAASGHALTIGANVGAIFTQFITMVPAHMPNWIKSFLHSIPRQVYSGVTLGTVMGVMGVTVQSYITAGGLKAFVWGFEKIGFTPPAYWQQNALNQAERLRRDSFLAISRDLTIARQEIAKLTGFITMWERALNQPDVSSEERENLEAAVAGAEESIEAQLKLTLLRWFKYTEVRDLQNSVLKANGFGVLASPNFEDPARITLFAEIGARTLAFSMSVAEIENVMNRNTIPDLGMSQDELRSLAEQIGVVQ